MQIEETILDSIRSRPRFKIFTDIPREVYTLHLKKFLAEKEMNYSGTIHSEEAIIRVKSEENYFWKPCLALWTEVDREENKTIIRGIFGPNFRSLDFFHVLELLFSGFHGCSLSRFGL